MFCCTRPAFVHFQHFLIILPLFKSISLACPLLTGVTWAHYISLSQSIPWVFPILNLYLLFLNPCLFLAGHLTIPLQICLPCWTALLVPTLACLPISKHFVFVAQCLHKGPYPSGSCITAWNLSQINNKKHELNMNIFVSLVKISGSSLCLSKSWG